MSADLPIKNHQPGYWSVTPADYEIVFEYGNGSRFRYCLKHVTQKQANDFANSYAKNCKIVRISKLGIDTIKSTG